MVVSHGFKAGEHPVRPDPPACYAEAAKLAHICFDRVLEARRVLEAHGMAPAHSMEKWEIPSSEAHLCDIVVSICCDIQAIENLLIHHGFADENEFIPLVPRWRVDGKKMHRHNWKAFQSGVRMVMHMAKQQIPMTDSFSEAVQLLSEAENADKGPKT